MPLSVKAFRVAKDSLEHAGGAIRQMQEADDDRAVLESLMPVEAP